jgi:hypothetical protein
MGYGVAVCPDHVERCLDRLRCRGRGYGRFPLGVQGLSLRIGTIGEDGERARAGVHRQPAEKLWHEPDALAALRCGDEHPLAAMGVVHSQERGLSRARAEFVENLSSALKRMLSLDDRGQPEELPPKLPLPPAGRHQAQLFRGFKCALNRARGRTEHSREFAQTDGPLVHGGHGAENPRESGDWIPLALRPSVVTRHARHPSSIPGAATVRVRSTTRKPVSDSD